jgi:hypothetical protein
MKPLLKSQLNALRELMDAGGAVIGSQWTTGSGKNTSRRTIPPFCSRIPRQEHYWIAYNRPERIKKVFCKHPRCEYLIAVTDMRKARKALKEAAQ